MSIKASVFASIITNPMNTHRFEVSIPEINFMAIVESTTFPAQGAFRQIPLWFQGEKISYPGQPENGGVWGFTIPDSDSGVIKQQFDDLNKKSYNQKLGIMSFPRWKDILIVCKDLSDRPVFSCTLHGAWYLNRDEVQLNGSQPDNALKWKHNFVYTWIEDGEITPANNASPI